VTISRLCCGQVQTYYSGFHSPGIVNLLVLTLSQGQSVINFGPTLLWSAKMLACCLLFKPVLMVQAAQD